MILDYAALSRAQWFPPSRLQELQWQRLTALLNHAYTHSPFYRQRFAEAGIRPADIRSLKDLGKIPLTTREDLRDPAALLAGNFSRNTLHVSSSSGSTGRRTTTYFDRRSWWIAKYCLKIRARRAGGLRVADRIAMFSETTAKNSALKQIVLRQRAYSILDSLDAQRDDLQQYNPTVLYGFPSTFALLADMQPSIRPRLAFTSSEQLDPHTRRKIVSGLADDVLDVYGCSEVKEISWECPEHGGYHINSDWLVVEFVDLESFSNAGEKAVVVTALHNYGMPLIRYVVGDTGRAVSGSCPCGRGLPLMAPSRGRSVDYFRLADGRLVSPYAMTCAIENIVGMKQYQIRQIRHDQVLVRVVPGPEFCQETSAEIKQALAVVLPGVVIEVGESETIAREASGKYRIVVSELGQIRRE